MNVWAGVKERVAVLELILSRPGPSAVAVFQIHPPTSCVPAWNVCLFSESSDSACHYIFSWSKASIPKHRSKPDGTRAEQSSELQAMCCASPLRRVLAPAPLKPLPSSYGACHRSYCLVNDTLPGRAFFFSVNSRSATPCPALCLQCP